MTNAPLRESADPSPRIPPPTAGRGVHAVPSVPSPAGGEHPAVRVLDAVNSVILGHDGAVRLAVATFLAGGHLLIEDSPGVGKTLLGKALARAIGGSFGRVQATADLLPSDVTGVSVFDPDARSWAFRPGPVFNNVVLVDELNRSTPRAQSSLLEAMAEAHVTVDGTTHPLPHPFFVIATQNPGSDHGTFPLVSGQRDRFAARLRLGIPPPEIERALLRGAGGTAHLDAIQPVATPAQWSAAQDEVAAVHAGDPVVDYIVSLVAAVRTHPVGDPELSPRASLMLLRLTQALAVLDGRSFVLPDDVKHAAEPVLAHRLAPTGGHDRGRIDAVLATVAVPPSS